MVGVGRPRHIRGQVRMILFCTGPVTHLLFSSTALNLNVRHHFTGKFLCYLYFLVVPWDATEYDIVIPVAGDVGLLYMRGHLCFFRAGRETEEKLNQYDHLSNMVLYINHHRPHYAAGWLPFLTYVAYLTHDSRGVRVLCFHLS